MSQVAKSASAFVRAFLAILVLELEDMLVRVYRPPKLADVHGDRWTVRLAISVEVVLHNGNAPESLVATARDPLSEPLQSARLGGAITRFLNQTS
jgi:hypothetical protein